MKGLPPINYADAAQLVEQLKLLGDEWFEGDYEDGTLVVGWGPATTVAAALLCMAQYAGQLEERMMELVESNTELAGQLTSIVKHPALQVQPWQAQMIQSIIDRPDERVELMKPRQYGRVTGVEWRGTSGDYFDNMEAINHVLAQEISKMAADRPEARAGVLDGPSIDPGEVIEAVEHRHIWQYDDDNERWKCATCPVVSQVGPREW
ncbi:MAG TPA: hypothetical protein PKW35_01400 [Nannocystaceae bacterium]|nr:hypothetical protein [Nannocystaceae bacterium]